MKRNMNRRDFLEFISTGLAGSMLSGCTGDVSPMLIPSAGRGWSPGDKPNFIIIFCDDLGYGDIGCFGSKKHRTPNIDKMAAEGIRFTSFYVTSGVCTPSRASLMTGCYPRRVDMHVSDLNECVLFPVAKKGLNPEEITIADMLKQRGYANACIGKWHLGDQLPFLPTSQGFGYYYGIPYSNDMVAGNRPKNPPLPLLRNEKVIEAPVNQNTLTKRYTEQAIQFITASKNRPFFIYLPHSMPHNPAHASEKFRGKSANGCYGDAVEEIDWSTGKILKTLKKLGIDGRTLVLFTSDNGAAERWGGSNAPLSGFKGSTWEGGMRVSCVCRWPGQIPAGKICDRLATTMDLMPTFAHLAGTELPNNRIIDGEDIWQLLSGEQEAKSPHKAFYYYLMDQLQAVRSGRWKLHLPLEQKRKNWEEPAPNSPMQLYDLEADIGETNNVADKYSSVVERLMALAEKARVDLSDVGLKGKGRRLAGWVDDPKPLLL